MTIEEIALKYVGVPYRHRGRDLSGLDCLGLILCVYRDAGIEIGYADQEDYAPDWFEDDPERYLRGIMRYGRPAERPLAQLDLAYFLIAGVVRHAGVMLDSTRFIHALEGRPVMVSRLAGFWSHNLAGARRFV